MTVHPPKDRLPFINREISWLHFNARVLQEAEDKNVPIISRLRFLGIFSNNLDEFFKIRYATVKHIVKSGEYSTKALGGFNPATILEQITDTVIKQQSHSLEVLESINQDLKKENIFVVDETQISDKQLKYIKTFFSEKVSNALSTIMLSKGNTFPILRDTEVYLAVQLKFRGHLNDNEATRFALIEIPKHINRFVVLPKDGNKNYVILIDDIVRLCLPKIFEIFDYHSIDAYMIKITRDSDLDIEEDLTKSFVKKIEESVKGREFSKAVRLVYDKRMGKEMLNYLIENMKLDSTDSVIPGGKYHKRSDYMLFPDMGRSDLVYQPTKSLPVKGLEKRGSFLKKIAQRDYLQYTPYHSFSNIVNFLREVAMDPKITYIKITLYRLANTSNVVNSLINAVKNGKKVNAFVELRARFDETANINYAETLKEAGVNLISEVPKLKVHSKMCVVKRMENGKLKYYGFISTGNFNENSSKIYTDFTLFTSNNALLKEVDKVFDFLDSSYIIQKFKHLIVSPHYTDKVFIKLINKEIKNAKIGRPAYIKLKLNNITNYGMIKKLYEASQKGVKIQIIVRGICCLIPGVKGVSENIEAISIVDKFLEHSRVAIFCNNKNAKVFISSADWMTRNIKNRVEIYESNTEEKSIVIFGIKEKGYLLARLIADHLRAISDINVIQGRIIFDESSCGRRVTTDMDKETFRNQSIVLIDDVLNTGKTLMYATKYLLEVPLKRFKTLVLINRNHKAYPIKADFKGLSLSTSISELVDVKFSGKQVTAYLL
ncbi:polyphosphate kinase [Elysia marginata]|uniref:ATP-polyphosphate phosphotransferase n=1 Tax=Elysia marginata TaxID=1093978 RepID=A0AAV4FNT4_9GAST|nr:polyphosphate kinase [Elysia marginata]